MGDLALRLRRATTALLVLAAVTLSARACGVGDGEAGDQPAVSPTPETPTAYAVPRFSDAGPAALDARPSFRFGFLFRDGNRRIFELQAEVGSWTESTAEDLRLLCYLSDEVDRSFADGARYWVSLIQGSVEHLTIDEDPDAPPTDSRLAIVNTGPPPQRPGDVQVCGATSGRTGTVASLPVDIASGSTAGWMVVQYTEGTRPPVPSELTGHLVAPVRAQRESFGCRTLDEQVEMPACRFHAARIGPR